MSRIFLAVIVEDLVRWLDRCMSFKLQGSFVPYQKISLKNDPNGLLKRVINYSSHMSRFIASETAVSASETAVSKSKYFDINFHPFQSPFRETAVSNCAETAVLRHETAHIGDRLQ